MQSELCSIFPFGLHRAQFPAAEIHQCLINRRLDWEIDCQSCARSSTVELPGSRRKTFSSVHPPFDFFERTLIFIFAKVSLQFGFCLPSLAALAWPPLLVPSTPTPASPAEKSGGRKINKSASYRVKIKHRPDRSACLAAR